MALLWRKVSTMLGLGEPEVRAPPLDGEIIYCKNNVCVHPPSKLSATVQHHPGYLNLRAEQSTPDNSTLVLTWIPNSSMKSNTKRAVELLTPEGSPTHLVATSDLAANVSPAKSLDTDSVLYVREGDRVEVVSGGDPGERSEEGVDRTGSVLYVRDGDRVEVVDSGDPGERSEKNQADSTQLEDGICNKVMDGGNPGEGSGKGPNHAGGHFELSNGATVLYNSLEADSAPGQISANVEPTESAKELSNTSTEITGDNGQLTKENLVLAGETEHCASSHYLDGREGKVDKAEGGLTSAIAGSLSETETNLDEREGNNHKAKGLGANTDSPGEAEGDTSSHDLDGREGNICKAGEHADSPDGVMREINGIEGEDTADFIRPERPTDLELLSSNSPAADVQAFSRKVIHPSLWDFGGQGSQDDSTGSPVKGPTVVHVDSSLIRAELATTPEEDSPTPDDSPTSDNSFTSEPTTDTSSPSVPETSPVTTPPVTHNLTFPENSVSYVRGGQGGRGGGSWSASDQICGVFSVDLGQMRSLRVFFSDDRCQGGQLVIASRESQYKILHFHHGGLDRLAQVFEEWKLAVKQKNKIQGPSERDLLCRNFSIFRPVVTSSECHPEEGQHSQVTSDTWHTHINERGQVEDDYNLRREIFFGGISEDIRASVWPFLLGYFSFTSTTEERKSLLERKLREYQDINRNRISMEGEEYEKFWRKIQSTVEKDVIRTDRSHDYFKGDDNPHIKQMKNILLNYAFYHPEMGYSQGMSDLLAPVLSEVKGESDSFWCFVGLMQNTIFVSSPTDEDMEKQLGYLRALIQAMLPKFYNHLVSLGDAMELLFCHRWILLCFKREFDNEDALHMWEACWAHYQTDYFHLFICLAIISIYGDDVIDQELPSDDMLLHFSSLAMHMNGDVVLRKARGLLYRFRLLPRIACTLDGLCLTCSPGMWDSRPVPEVYCVGHPNNPDFKCPHGYQLTENSVDP